MLSTFITIDIYIDIAMDLYDFTALGGGKEKVVEYVQDARILQRELHCEPC